MKPISEILFRQDHRGQVFLTELGIEFFTRMGKEGHDANVISLALGVDDEVRAMGDTELAQACFASEEPVVRELAYRFGVLIEMYERDCPVAP